MKKLNKETNYKYHKECPILSVKYLKNMELLNKKENIELIEGEIGIINRIRFIKT